MTSTYGLLILVTITHCSIFNHLEQNVLKFTPKDLDKSVKKGVLEQRSRYVPINYKRQDLIDIQAAKSKAKVIQEARTKGRELEKGIQLPNIIKAPSSNEKQRYHLDSLLNVLKRNLPARRFEDYSTDTSSSSVELKNWKDEWKEHWLQKKFEAINASQPKGDTVNMAAARPWGLPCGDPNQHDMPWGTCMLPMECEAEYRIYRGDYFCGRTQFICCALQLTTYDMYQGFDVSFADSSLETDSEEKRNRDRGSKERKRRKKLRDQRRRRLERLRRKRKMRRNIRKIVREIQKILNRSYRNGTTEKKRRTRQLKKFVKMLKKKYKEERKVIKDLHEMDLIKADVAVQEKLNQIKAMNQQFIKNGTFRDIIVNGTINTKDALLLMKAYPDLAEAFRTRRRGVDVKRPRDYLDYDIEYGYLYY
ncbi:uncharacterized protein [Epargyreus clarus]|uniref:uncharacterized protein n=1 Tax=Epargyreus clarus TaxID=520877 RepID=UPI003C2ECF68